jgi:zinc protease
MARLYLVMSLVAPLALVASASAEPGPPLQFTLENGLKACVIEDHSTDLAAVYLVLRVTADCEPQEKAGIRALLQHALRFGWELRMKADDSLAFLADMSDAQGGLATATDWEYVGFGFSGTSDTLEEGIGFLAKGVFEPELTQEAYDGAKKVLTEVLAQSSEPAESTHRLFRLALTGSVSRAYPVGVPRTLSGISPADLGAFHRRFYVPGLAAICVASPTPAAEVRSLIEKHLASLPAGRVDLPQPPTREGSDVECDSNAALVVPGNPDVEVASLVVGVPAPSYDDPSFPVAYVIQALLGPETSAPGRIGRDDNLYASLGLGFTPADARKRGFVESLTPQVSACNYLALHAYVAPSRAEAVRGELLDYYDQLATKTPSLGDLQQAKLWVIGHEARLYDSLRNRSLLTARALVLGQPVPPATDFRKRVEDVTAEDIQRVARRFFGRHAAGVEYPEGNWQQERSALAGG